MASGGNASALEHLVTIVGLRAMVQCPSRWRAASRSLLALLSSRYPADDIGTALVAQREEIVWRWPKESAFELMA